MAVTFIKQKKKQKYLLFISIVFFMISLVVLWWGFFREEKPFIAPSVEPAFIRDINIDFNMLDRIKEENFESFEKIPPLSPDEKIGRENPFLNFGEGSRESIIVFE